MTYEQTREQFVLAWNSNAYLNMCESSDMKNAINALEKQIPKKPINYAIDNNGYMIYDCECPSCKCSHRERYPFAYCNHCGQALDWSDTD